MVARVLRSATFAMLALAVLATVAGACASAKKRPPKPAEQLAPPRPTAIDHEPCDTAGHRIEVHDPKGAGKPAVVRVFDDAGRELCRISDFDADGRPEMYEYFGAAGALRRREASFEGGGAIDAIEHYENGKLTLRELDTTGKHRLDTWDYFDPATGKRVRRERDADGDSRTDQWWAWERDVLTIDMDRRGFGRPDPSMRVTVSLDAGVASSPRGDGGADGGRGVAAPYDASFGAPEARGKGDASVASDVVPSPAGAGGKKPKPQPRRRP